MNKQTIITASVVSVLLFVTACTENFLDHDPPVERVEDNFFQNQADVEEALFGVYEVLTFKHGRGNEGFVPVDLASNILSDDAYAGGSGPGDQPELLEFNRHNIATTNGKALALWSDFYSGIFRSNLLLDRIDDADFNDEELREIYRAEARFLRAHFYFELVRFFGYVPQFERPLVAEDTQMPQTEPGEVYNFIVEELLEAMPNLRENIPSDELGRVSKWAAKSMLGRVYLFHQDYVQPTFQTGELPVSQNEVVSHLEDVIYDSGHELKEDFADLWGVEGNNNNEAIFSVQHIETGFGDWGYLNGSVGNWATTMTGMRGVGFHPEYSQGWSFQPVTQDLVDTFNPDTDSRYFHSILDPVEEDVNHDAEEMHQWQGYAFKKFYPRTDDSPSVNTEFNWPYNRPVYRYSDVLLMAAELGAADAQNYFDQVRQRAYGDDFEQINASKENIIEERRLEFAGEGHRYWDLLRLGINEAQDRINAQQTDNIPIEFDSQRLGLLPIPNSEIDLSEGTLNQNPGY